MADKPKKNPEAKPADSKAGSEEKKEVVHAPKKPHKSQWNLQRALNRAKRFESVEEWARGNQSSYKAASYWGWMKECTAHMKNAPNVTKLDEHRKKKTKSKTKRGAAKSTKKSA